MPQRPTVSPYALVLGLESVQPDTVTRGMWIYESGACLVEVVCQGLPFLAFDSRHGILTNPSKIRAAHDISDVLYNPHSIDSGPDEAALDPDVITSGLHITDRYAMYPGTYTVKATAVHDGPCAISATWTAQGGVISHDSKSAYLLSGQVVSFDILVGP
jgi:hypothetical protein